MVTDKEHSYFEKEDRCKRIFERTLQQYGGVWHLCTPGEKQPVIFKNKKDYTFAMTLVAMCVYDCPDVQIITFELMSNHVHFVICGSEADIQAFFTLFKKRLRRYLVNHGDWTDLRYFICKNPIAITTLESLRNQIAYTNRNNFVVDPDQTPFSYPFGANSLFFLPIAKERRQGDFSHLSARAKRQLLHARETDYPESFILVDGYISPVNYCRIDIGEGVFRDARHYFNKLSKNIEAYREIAERLGDTIFYTDDELNDMLTRICRDKYNTLRPSQLGRTDKIELSRKLHFDYNADNAQISRLLSLPKSILDQLFPQRQ